MERGHSLTFCCCCWWWCCRAARASDVILIHEPSDGGIDTLHCEEIYSNRQNLMDVQILCWPTLSLSLSLSVSLSSRYLKIEKDSVTSSSTFDSQLLNEKFRKKTLYMV